MAEPDAGPRFVINISRTPVSAFFGDRGRLVKTIIAALCLAILAVGFGVLSINRMSALRDDQRAIKARHVAGQQQITELSGQLGQMFRGMLIYAVANSVDAKPESGRQAVRDADEQVDATLGAYTGLAAGSPARMAAIRDFGGALAHYRALRNTALFGDPMAVGYPAPAQGQVLPEFTKLQNAITTSVQTLQQTEDAEAGALGRRAADAYRHARTVTLIALVIGMLMALFVCGAVYQLIRPQLGTAPSALEAVAEANHPQAAVVRSLSPEAGTQAAVVRSLSPEAGTQSDKLGLLAAVLRSQSERLRRQSERLRGQADPARWQRQADRARWEADDVRPRPADVRVTDQPGVLALAASRARDGLRGAGLALSATAHTVGAGTQRLIAGAREAATARQAATARRAGEQAVLMAVRAGDIEPGDRAIGAPDESGGLLSTMDAFDKISHSSDDLGKVVKLIAQIAEQANVLAQNATTQAARAAAAGRSTAVAGTQVMDLPTVTSAMPGPGREITARHAMAGDVQQRASTRMELAQEAMRFGELAQASLTARQTTAPSGRDRTRESSDPSRQLSGPSLRVSDPSRQVTDPSRLASDLARRIEAIRRIGSASSAALAAAATVKPAATGAPSIATPPAASPLPAPAASPAAGPVPAIAGAPAANPVLAPAAGPAANPVLAPAAGPVSGPAAGSASGPPAGPAAAPVLAPAGPVPVAESDAARPAARARTGAPTKTAKATTPVTDALRAEMSALDEADDMVSAVTREADEVRMLVGRFRV